MTDAYTSTVVLAYGIEVKETGGDYNEVVMQLGGWCAAGLEKIRSMMKAGVEQTLLQPLVRLDCYRARLEATYRLERDRWQRGESSLRSHSC
jgi:hypothetical protein